MTTDDLINDATPAETSANDEGQRRNRAQRDAPVLRMIPLNCIIASDCPLRTGDDPDSERLDGLSASVATHGVLEPILVRPLTRVLGDEEKYELIAGERRRRGAVAAGVTHIPALIVECPDSDALEIAIIENVQREPLNPLDEARAIGRLRDTYNLSVRSTAARLGVQRGWVQERLQLLGLPDDLQSLVSGHPDTATHARELARVSDVVERERLKKKVAAGTMALAELRKHIKRLTATPSTPEQAANTVAALATVENSNDTGSDAGITEAPPTDTAPLRLTEFSTLEVTDTSLDRAEAVFDDLMGDLRSLQRSLLTAKALVSTSVCRNLYAELDETVNIILDVMTELERRAA